MATTYTNRAKWGTGIGSMKQGRQRYLDADTSARPTTAKAKTTVRGYTRRGRAAWADSALAKRRT